MRKIASLLQVDELHLFDMEGRLYAGSEPKYYDYTFRSGEQMQFFLPMLDDVDLQLCLPRRTPDRFYPGTDRPNRPGK